MYTIWFNPKGGICAQNTTQISANILHTVTFAKCNLTLNSHETCSCTGPLFSFGVNFHKLLGKNGNFTYLKVSIKVYDFEYNVKKYTSHFKSHVPLPASTCLNCKLIIFLSGSSETLKGIDTFVSKMFFSRFSIISWQLASCNWEKLQVDYLAS